MTLRSYDQFCGLARALDLVGDRWTLLIIRELLISPRRYADLHEALPGAASNLLAERLRDLVREGVIVTRVVPAPTPARLYELTQRGRELEPAVLALTRWGGHRMLAGKRGDAFRPDWLVVAFRALLADLPWAEPTRVRFVVEGTSILITATREGSRVALDAVSPIDIELTTDGETALGIVSGRLPLDRAAASRRCAVTGRKPVVRRVAAVLATERVA